MNNAEDLNPCATIIAIAPIIPHFVEVMVPPNINPICPTDEYAINDFRSVCRMQINLVNIAPTIEILRINAWIFFGIYGNINLMRSSPYPPNFSKMAARIIEPATGAST